MEALGGDRLNRDRAGEDEEEQCEQPLVGERADLHAPGPRVDVLVDLTDPDAPEQE